MKILVYTPVFWPDIGGIETISTQLVAALQARGHELVVVTGEGQSSQPPQRNDNITPVYRFPMREALGQKNLRQLLAIQREVSAIKERFQPDLIHLHLGGPTPIAYFHLQTIQIAPAPTLVTLHNCFTNFAGNSETVLGNVLCNAAWIVAGSDFMRTDILTIDPALALQTLTIRHCLPAPAAPARPLPFAPPRLLYLGRLVAEKGVDLALTAFQQLAARHPQLTFLIAGDGPERARLTAQAAAWGLAERVTFLGNQPWALRSELFNQATLVLMPSRWHEPFGLVALEAAQMGRPVIATNVGGLPEIIRQGQTGYLVAPADPTALATAIAALLADPAGTAQMGQDARHHAQTHFAWTAYVTAYEELFTKLTIGQGQ